ncbi:hypothetical protein CLCR_02641 [Cladophialophora carrionii]|uniref:Uncharacterized protein n=1 Tax=Cladophialophora carrionii TaxID=86049 RepID=A0A1C1CF01_9EURO|nr:hypothetical protein CLCR_02641 [Cladophialophora carrionii]
MDKLSKEPLSIALLIFRTRNPMHGAIANDPQQEAATDHQMTIVGLLLADGALEDMGENARLDVARRLMTIMIEVTVDAAHPVTMDRRHHEDMMRTHMILEDRLHHRFEATETYTLEVIPTVDPEARLAMVMLAAMVTMIGDTRMVLLSSGRLHLPRLDWTCCRLLEARQLRWQCRD